MRMIMLAVAVLLASADIVEAVTCRDSSQRDGYWQYRLIDGRRCWYRGKHRLDKEDLHWAARVSSSTKLPLVRTSGGGEASTAPVSPPIPSEPEPTVAELVSWPDPPLPFTDRFGDLPASRALPQHIYDDLPPAFGGSPRAAFAFAPEPPVDEDYRAPAALMLVLVLMWLLLLPPIVLVAFILWRRRLDQIEFETPTWRIVQRWTP